MAALDTLVLSLHCTLPLSGDLLPGASPRESEFTGVVCGLDIGVCNCNCLDDSNMQSGLRTSDHTLMMPKGFWSPPGPLSFHTLVYTSLTFQLLVPAFVLEGFLWLEVPGNAGPSTLTQEQPSTKD